MPQKPATNEIVLAGGCFWCIEAAIRNCPGVIDVVSGYATAEKHEQVSYEDAVFGRVQARESVLVTYDTSVTDFEKVVRYFFTIIDPVDAGGQFHDRGYDYTTAIYVSDETERSTATAIIDELNMSEKYDQPIATVVEDRKFFYPAEEYHQQYKEKNKDHYERYYKGSGREAYFGK